MAYEQNITVSKSTADCYASVLLQLEKQGFKIGRRRDVAYLVQASKEVDGRSFLFNITCGMGRDTKITMGCISSETGAEQGEQPIIEAFLQALEQELA